MSESEIGIVVPTFNSAKTLEWTLLALKSQEGCSVNIIVVDSGSTDETLEICARHKVRTEYDPPGNMYRAINAGMRLLDTKWISYLNSDDIIYCDAYSRLIELGDCKGADIVYGHSDYIDWNGRFIHSFKASHPLLLPGLVHSGLLQFAQPAAIFRKVVYEDLKGFSSKYRSIADFDFFARAILTGKKFERLSFPTVTAFRLHLNQFSHRESGIVQEETSQFFKECKAHKSFLGLLSLSMWRFLNIKHYLIRKLRNGRLKSRPKESKVSSL
jgi:glycosyltransferase involved in cell wall biosynthesis